MASELAYKLIEIIQSEGFTVFGPGLCCLCHKRYQPHDNDQGRDVCATCADEIEQEYLDEATGDL